MCVRDPSRLLLDVRLCSRNDVPLGRAGVSGRSFQNMYCSYYRPARTSLARAVHSLHRSCSRCPHSIPRTCRYLRTTEQPGCPLRHPELLRRVSSEVQGSGMRGLNVNLRAQYGFSLLRGSVLAMWDKLQKQQSVNIVITEQRFGPRTYGMRRISKEREKTADPGVT